MLLKLKSALGSRYFLRYEVNARLADKYPLKWEEYFGHSAPLAVEIGFGNGDFLVDWAKKHPDWNFVGIERSIESMTRLQKRLANENLTNVRAVYDDARFAVRELFPNNSVKHLIMNFPDPWPKKRHASRRTLTPSFVRTLAAVLRRGGYFELVTDQEWYAWQTLELFAASDSFSVKELDINPDRPLMTKYEKKWRSLGRNVYRVLSKKVKSQPITRLLKESKMPHVFIESTISPTQVSNLIGKEYQDASIFFIVKALFRQVEENAFLFRVITRDLDYIQQFYLALVPHDEKWLLKLDPITQPYRTPAVKLAVQKIGEWLVD